jgi:hypothetical protein
VWTSESVEPPRVVVENLAGDLGRDLTGCASLLDDVQGYWQTGNYEQTAHRLKLDRRTVRSKINPELLAALRAGRSEGGETNGR